MWKENKTPQNEGLPARYGNCPPGYRVNRDRCFQCFPGSYTYGQDTRCFLCPKNFYMPNFAADSCWPCPDGRITLKYGSDSEDQCINSSGTEGFSNSTNLIIIAVCIASFIIALVAIAVVLHFIFRPDIWKKKPREIKVCPDMKALIRKRSADDHIYESISYKNSSEEAENIYSNIDDSHDPIYENIANNDDDNENDYLTPIQMSKPSYLEVAPEPPPKRTMNRTRSDSDLGKSTNFNAIYYCLIDLPATNLFEHIGDIPLENETEVKDIETTEFSTNFENSQSPYNQLGSCAESQNQKLWTPPNLLDMRNMNDSAMHRSSLSLVDTTSLSDKYCSKNSDPKHSSTNYCSPDIPSSSIVIELKVPLERTSSVPQPPPEPSLKLNSTVPKKPGERSRLFR